MKEIISKKKFLKKSDEYLQDRGRYYIRPLKSGLAERKTLIYSIECPDKSLIKTQWICAEDTFKKIKDEGRIVFKKLRNGKFNVYKKHYEKDKEGKVLTESIIYDLAYNQQGKEEIKRLFNIKEGRDVIFGNAKPEALLQRIIELSTKKGDIILDYHLGSGTTAAVAHKMERQYIGIEQMNYIENITCQRLKKVIEGEQGGVSKDVNWKGGGSFVYLELKKYNQDFIEKIDNAKTTEQLFKVWQEMKSKSFINYNIDIKEQDAHIKEFKALSIKEQKETLCDMLDKNQLYVNLSSLDDKDFKCTKDEKKVTKYFYDINDDE